MKIYAPCPTHHFGRPSISDVSLHLYNTFYRGHRLQVNCNNERKVTFPRSITHQKQGEQKAIRYPQTNAQTEWHVYLLEIRGLFCWYIQVPAQNLRVAMANQATRQITLVRMGYWARHKEGYLAPASRSSTQINHTFHS